MNTDTITRLEAIKARLRHDDEHGDYDAICDAIRKLRSLRGQWPPAPIPPPPRSQAGESGHGPICAEQSAPRVPDGRKLVPVEPTPVMVADGKQIRREGFSEIAIYNAMLAAAPEAPHG